MRFSRRLAGTCALVPALVGADALVGAADGERRAVVAPARTERFTDLPPILLPETVPAVVAGDEGGEVILAFVVDTMGRVERSTVETLAATDSTAARRGREALARVRYVPARVVLHVDACVRIDGALAHCGGATPVVRRLRARVVLRLESYGVRR